MKYENNVIELSPYLPAFAPSPEPPARRSLEQALPYLSALVENLVTVGIGVCFVIGLVVSLSVML